MKNANPVSVVGYCALLILLITAAGGCGGSQPAPASPPKPLRHFFSIPIGDQTVSLQLAITSSEMERGLMGRTDLGPDQGMLFVYREPRQVSFWMRNTPTPLDIGFFTSDGVLREVYPLLPFDERSVPSRRDDIQYALEMPQGWFEAAGVRPGHSLGLSAVAAAVRERGFSPEDFRGLNESRARE